MLEGRKKTLGLSTQRTPEKYYPLRGFLGTCLTCYVEEPSLLNALEGPLEMSWALSPACSAPPALTTIRLHLE